MNAIKGLSSFGTRGAVLLGGGVRTIRTAASLLRKAELITEAEPEEDKTQWPRKIFSGIQPTGSLHLGNYLGAVQKWTQLQNDMDDVTYCIVDMHSITLPQNPALLRENIFEVAATMLACGIDVERSTVFVQSAVHEHSELCWILNCLSTMARLGHLPQYKEKARKFKDIPLGLFVYPVLQAADIMLYKSTHVPVGEDQIQHIQLTQHLSKIFNTKYGPTFPICHAIVNEKEAARIRSLRDPTKKMSKSDTDPKATINLLDEPDVIVEKIKKAMTDFTSDVGYDPDNRLGVSNLIVIHSLVTGQSIENIVEEASTIDTGRYKLRVAEAVVEHLTPIRTKIKAQLQRRNELVYLLELGADKARATAEKTMTEVRQKLGLGALLVPATVFTQENVETPSRDDKGDKKRADESSSKTTVPKQNKMNEKFDVQLSQFVAMQPAGSSNSANAPKSVAAPLPNSETETVIQLPPTEAKI